MLVARTRSSRFFLVVLHLVCASTHLRRKDKPNGRSFIFWKETAATIQSQSVHTSVSMISVMESSNRNAAIQDISKLEPYWLQDAHDQKCFGPMGLFSECGDANLWRVIPKSKRHARRRQWIRWAIEQDHVDQQALQGYYALQVFDQDISEFYDPYREKLSEEKTPESSADRNEDFINKECMTRRRKDNKLVIVPCSEDRAWYWRVNEYGTLHFDKPARGFGSSSRRAASGTKKRLLNKRQNLESCVWRNHASEAVLSSCDGNQPASGNQNATSSSSLGGNGKERVAQVQFVRHNYQRDIHIHHSPSSASAKEASNIKEQEKIKKYLNLADQKASQASATSSSSTGNINLPSRIDIAHSHASVPSDRAEPRLSTFQVTSILPHRSSETVSKQIPRFLGNTNPILIATRPKLTTTTSKEGVGTSSIKNNNKNNMRKKSTRMEGEDKKISQPLLHNNDNLSSSLSEKPIVRKIQTNPYIAASNDERWTDPKTGLIYRTDLCQYLGHERKDAGRHTLTGVGQYTKTMLNIKVSEK